MAGRVALRSSVQVLVFAVIADLALACSAAHAQGTTRASNAPARERSGAPGTQTAPSVPAGELTRAASRGDAATVEALLRQGANANEGDIERGLPTLTSFTSSSPLLVAVKRNHEAVARMLLAAGASARWRESTGETIADLAVRRRLGSPELREALTTAAKREATLVPAFPLPEPLAVAALRFVAASGVKASPTPRVDAKQLRNIEQMALYLSQRWPPRLRERSPELAWSLTKNLNALEWAIANRDEALLDRVVEDLKIKRQDCATSPEGAFDVVNVSIHALLPDGTERRGLRVRYIERLYFDLLPGRPALETRWREFAGATAVDDEPLPAGNWVVAIRTPDGLSGDAKVSVSRFGPKRIDVALQR
jgi:ankyrin repeat protein